MIQNGADFESLQPEKPDKNNCFVTIRCGRPIDAHRQPHLIARQDRPLLFVSVFPQIARQDGLLQVAVELS